MQGRWFWNYKSFRLSPLPYREIAKPSRSFLASGWSLLGVYSLRLES